MARLTRAELEARLAVAEAAISPEARATLESAGTIAPQRQGNFAAFYAKIQAATTAKDIVFECYDAYRQHSKSTKPKYADRDGSPTVLYRIPKIMPGIEAPITFAELVDQAFRKAGITADLRSSVDALVAEKRLVFKFTNDGLPMIFNPELTKGYRGDSKTEAKPKRNPVIPW